MDLSFRVRTVVGSDRDARTCHASKLMEYGATRSVDDGSGALHPDRQFPHHGPAKSKSKMLLQPFSEPATDRMVALADGRLYASS